jgi:hypothetical protein
MSGVLVVTDRRTSELVATMTKKLRPTIQLGATQHNLPIFNSLALSVASRLFCLLSLAPALWGVRMAHCTCARVCVCLH